MDLSASPRPLVRELAFGHWHRRRLGADLSRSALSAGHRRGGARRGGLGLDVRVARGAGVKRACNNIL